MIGDTIRSAREKRGLSRGALAREVGVSHVHITKIERGERVPSLKTLAKIQRVIDIGFGALMEDEHDI